LTPDRWAAIQAGESARDSSVPSAESPRRSNPLIRGTNRDRTALIAASTAPLDVDSRFERERIDRRGDVDDGERTGDDPNRCPDDDDECWEADAAMDSEQELWEENASDNECDSDYDDWRHEDGDELDNEEDEVEDERDDYIDDEEIEDDLELEDEDADDDAPRFRIH
jgi:hypothetical protein